MPSYAHQKGLHSMTHSSSAVADLQDKWHTLHDLGSRPGYLHDPPVWHEPSRTHEGA